MAFMWVSDLSFIFNLPRMTDVVNSATCSFAHVASGKSGLLPSTRLTNRPFGQLLPLQSMESGEAFAFGANLGALSIGCVRRDA
jgi:hypothetical protein